MAITQVSNSLVKQDLTISGGTVDNTVIGSGTPAAGTFTTVAGTLASTVTGTTAAASDNSTKIATTAYVTTALANLVDSAPGTLNTLNELAAALGDDASFSTTVTNSIAGKVALSGSGQTIADSGNFTIDAAGDIILDADGGDILIKDAGTSIGQISRASSGSNFILKSSVSDADIEIKGVDGGANITALTLDMSEGGAATFNAGATVGGALAVSGAATAQDFRSTGIQYFTHATDVRFRTTSGAERMRIDSSGRIGIGVAPTGSWNFQLASSGGASRIRLQNSTTGSADGDGGSIAMEGNDFVLQNSESGVVKVEMGGSERFRIDSSGDVGIGTASPNTFDSRARNLVVRDTGDAGIAIVSGDSSDARLTFTIAADTGLNNGAIHYDNSNDKFSFSTAGTDRMYIDNSGNVGIGTSSPGRLLTLFNNDQPVFQITNNTSGTASTRGLIIYQQSGTTNTIIDNQGSGSGGSIQFYRAGTLSLGINSAGEIFTKTNGVIETASSAGTLTISGGSTNKGGQILLRGGNGDSDVIFKAQASTATPAERMRINSAGNVMIGVGTETATYSSFVSGQQNRIFELSSTSAQNQGGATIVMSNSTVNAANCSLGSLTFAARGSSASDKRGAIIGSNTTADSSSAVSAQMYFYTMNSGSLTTKMLIHPAGVVSVPNGIELGSGIDGTAANVLDDYEEGTWTPTFSGFSGTYAVQTARYIKIGQQVTVWWHLDIQTTGGTGTLQVHGLPFTHVNITNFYGGVGTLHCNSWATMKKPDNGLVQTNTSYIRFFQNIDGSSVGQVTLTDVGTGNFLGSATYFSST